MRAIDVHRPFNRAPEARGQAERERTHSIGDRCPGGHAQGLAEELEYLHRRIFRLRATNARLRYELTGKRR